MSPTITPRRRHLTAGAVTVALLATAVGCGDDDGGSFLGAGDGAGLPGDLPDDRQPEMPETPAAVAAAAAEDVEIFWAEAYPSLYDAELTPISGWHPYDSTNPPPDCGPQQISYQEVAENAFYCSLSDFVAYDEEALLSWLWEDFGGFSIAIVMAHEYGHAVQERANELMDTSQGSSVRIEMQADCYSGAWVGWVAEGNSSSFAIATEQLNNSVAGMIAIRDLPGDDPGHPMAHGSGFDRVSSFQDGYENGVAACAGYTELHQQGELAITQIPFSSAEYETGGNLPLQDETGQIGLYTLVAEYLEIYFERFFEEGLGREWRPVDDLLVLTDPASDEISCGGETLSGAEELEWFSAYCSDENTVVIDGTTLGDELWDRIGDFAVAAEIARLWAFAAQEQLGVEPSIEASLQADCLTGNFGGTAFPDDSDQTMLGPHPTREGVYARLSPGDLDELIMSILAYDHARSEDAGTAFQRAAAVRDGALAGIDGRLAVDECASYHPFE